MIFRLQNTLNNSIKSILLMINKNSNTESKKSDSSSNGNLKSQIIVRHKVTKRPNKYARLLNKNTPSISPSFTFSDANIRINLTTVTADELNRKKVRGYKYLSI